MTNEESLTVLLYGFAAFPFLLIGYMIYGAFQMWKTDVKPFKDMK